jgi:hypothetical protein
MNCSSTFADGFFNPSAQKAYLGLDHIVEVSRKENALYCWALLALYGCVLIRVALSTTTRGLRREPLA